MSKHLIGLGIIEGKEVVKEEWRCDHPGCKDYANFADSSGEYCNVHWVRSTVRLPQTDAERRKQEKRA